MDQPLLIVTPAENETVSLYPMITGTSAANVTVTLYQSYVGTTVWGQTTADENGNWMMLPSTALPEGQFGLVVKDSTGSGWSNNRLINVKALGTRPPPGDQPLVIVTPGENETVSRRPMITGTSDHLATITLYESNVGSTVWGETNSDENGNWSMVPSVDLPTGTFGLVVRASTGPNWSNNRYINVKDTVAIKAPQIDTPTEEAQVPRYPTLSGMASPNARIDLYESYVGDKIWGSSYADNYGNWSIVPTEGLPVRRFGLVVNDGSNWSNNRYVQVSDGESRLNLITHKVTGYLNEIIPYVSKILDLIAKDAYTPPSGGRSAIPITGDVVGVALKIYDDIHEYGFVWDRSPDTTRKDRTGVILSVDANTHTPQGANVTVKDDWLVSFVSSNVTFPVPIPCPASKWSYDNLASYYAAGDTANPLTQGDTNFPFNGPGAYVGQLLYKFGEQGQALPIYNENYASTLNDRGELFLRMNIPDERLPRCYGALQVYIGMFRPSCELVFVTVIPDSGWVACGITRYQNWDQVNNLSFSEQTFMALDAPAVSRKNIWGSPALTTQYAATGGDCGPAGISQKLINIVGDTSYPYSGPGARYGQLIYKWGENGTAIPAWHSGELGGAQSGDLLLRMNDRGNGMDNNSGALAVVVS